jgi:hypothetical protein
MSAVMVQSLDLEHLSATICAELAAGLSDAAGIRTKYNITVAQWEQLKKSPAFRKMLLEAIHDWRGDLNAGKRITKKAEIMLEDSLPVLYDIAHDIESPRQQRIDSVKQMTVLAGRANTRGEVVAGSDGQRGAVINISIVTKNDEQQLVINGSSEDATSNSQPIMLDLSPEDDS